MKIIKHATEAALNASWYGTGKAPKGSVIIRTVEVIRIATNMSYSLFEARGEELDTISTAIRNDDSTTLFLKAQDYAEQGDMEYATMLNELAKKAQRNEWKRDDYKEDREADYADMHFAPAEGLY